MKIALCLSGHLRTFERTYESVREQLQLKYDFVDVFVSTWKNLGNQFAYHAHYKDGSDKADPIISKEQVADIYHTTNLYMDDADTEPVSLQIKKDYGGMKTQSGANVAQVMVMLYKIWHCNQLKKEHETKNNFKYDVVIRSRFDVYLNRINMEMATKCVQFVPGHMGLNDIVFMGPSQMMDDVCDIHTVMSPTIPFSEFVNVEHLWHTHVTNNEIPFNASYDAFDYSRYTHQGIFDIHGRKIGEL